MTFLSQCGMLATCRPLVLSHVPYYRTFPVRHSSSLSAVWRGVRRGESGTRRMETRRSETRRDSPAGGNRSALDAWADSMPSDGRNDGPSRGRRSQDGRRATTTTRNRDSFEESNSRMRGGRDHFKIKKARQKFEERQKLQDEEENGGGRKTRSKRFNNEEYSFGKKSLVYQVNKGELKNKIWGLVQNKLESPGAESPHDPSSTQGHAAVENSGFGNSSNRRRDMGRDRKSDGGRDRHSDIDRGRRSDMGRDRQSDGGRDRRSDMGRDRRSDMGRDRQSDGGRNRERRGRPHPADSRRSAILEELGAEQNSGGRSHRSESDVRRTPDGPPPMAVLPHTTAASQFLFGTWAVIAALREAKRKFYHLYIYTGSKHDSFRSIRQLADRQGVRVSTVPESAQHVFDKASKGRPHNGLVLEASPLPQLPIEGLGPVSEDGYDVVISHQSREDAAVNGTEPHQRWPVGKGGHKPLVLLLNEILDPGNLGAMLRSARFLGAAAVAVSKQTSSPITTTALKAAAGAGEEMTLFTVADPLGFVEASSNAGWSTYAAVAPAAEKRNNSNNWKQLTTEDVAEQDPLREKPCVLVLGNEGEGLSKKLRSTVDRHVSIPSFVGVSGESSSVDSLNVSVATALLCDAFTKGARTVPRTFQEKLMVDAKKARSGETLF